MTIFTRAHVPPELEHEWLQHLRDFDTAHPGCHFEVVLQSETKTIDEMVNTLDVSPGLDWQVTITRKPTETE